ncbi:FAD-dependent monooxygenase [Streptomyces sp. NPDC042638]|uniref:FAD-dependent monooxygenase n=1 Tax=Streptomyces sp. NPDC042638 TaxID=3154333 RepID=UPI0033C23C22
MPAGGCGDRGGAGSRAASRRAGGGRARGRQGGHRAHGVGRGGARGVHRHRRRAHRGRGRAGAGDLPCRRRRWRRVHRGHRDPARGPVPGALRRHPRRLEHVFGDRIAELAQDADGVDVVFAGGNRRRFDLVVGADGLHSELRAMVFGPHERFLRRLGHMLAFYSVPNEFGLDRWLLEYQDQESGRYALLRPIQDATRAMAMFYSASADFDVDHRDVAAQKRLLRERMAGLGWLAPDILAHLDDTPDFYLDQVAQVVMDRWSSGRVGLLGDAAFSSSPMSGQGTGLALVGAYLAGELAAAEWDPDAGFARYEARMRSFVEANQEIGRLNARSRDVPGPETEPRPDFTGEWFTELVGRAINGVELPDYAGVPDSAAPAGSPITSSAKL